MKMRCTFYASLLVLLSLMGFQARGQTLTVVSNPFFANQNTSPLTIIYDANRGNAALASVATPNLVFGHSGVVTNASANDREWRHVPMCWPSATGCTSTQANLMTMTSLGNGRWSFTFPNGIRQFYNVPANEQVRRVGFVFRNSTGSVVGRESDGGDIFLELFDPAGFHMAITSPIENPLYQPGQTLSPISVTAVSSANANFRVLDGTTVLFTQNGVNNISTNVTPAGSGRRTIRVEATEVGGSSRVVIDSFYYFIRPQVNVAPLPTFPGVTLRDGINYLDRNPNNPDSVVLILHAPQKNYVFAVGDFSNWELDSRFYMNRTPATGNTLTDDRYWVVIPNLQRGVEYGFQYWVTNLATDPANTMNHQNTGVPFNKPVLNNATLRISDPYTEKVLDPDQDRWIPASVYPNIKAYPVGKTTGIVSLLETGKQPYNWQVPNFARPRTEDLVVYELLVRDFTRVGTFKAALDSLPYLDSMGVNCIHVLPVMEFEGNDSWGYNPSHFFAVDKAYGPADDFKRYIDACHQRGIAVILDMVVNHAFSQCPLVRLYMDPDRFYPTPNNPWLNQFPRHAFNVGSDFNHESIHTQRFVKRVNDFWLTEYNLDGFRFDLSKGFTQNMTCGMNTSGAEPTLGNCDVGAWNSYDQSRVNICGRIKNEIEATKPGDTPGEPGAYVIFEHLGNDDEERELAWRGIILWGIMHAQYAQNAMGFTANSSISRAWYRNRWTLGGNSPAPPFNRLLSYGESHDEQRLAVDTRDNGNNSQAGYNVRDLNVSLDRLKTTAAFIFGIPGPKMLWQFGERGYDYSINWCYPSGTGPFTNPAPGFTTGGNFDCRTGRKPPRWDYMGDPARKRLYDTYAALINLKTGYRIFGTNGGQPEGGGGGVTISEGGNVGVNSLVKRIKIEPAQFTTNPQNADQMNVVIIGNFDVVNQNANPDFHHTGAWYDYFNNDTLNVTNQSAAINLRPGEFRIFTNFRLPEVRGGIVQYTRPQATVLNGSLNGTNAVLSWGLPPDVTHPTGMQRTAIRIVRSANPNGPFVNIANLGPSATTFTDNNISGTFYYRVVLVNNFGRSASNTVLLSTITPPSNLSADAVAFNQINLTWTDNTSGETGYVVERALAAAGPFSEISTSVAANATSFTDNGVIGGTQYFYRVSAILSGGGRTNPSNVANATTPAAPVPATPTGLTATATTNRRITLAWTDASTTETGYAVERALASGGPFNVIAGNLAANSTGFVDEPVASATQYFYRVRAFNGTIFSAYSSVANATTGAPDAPSTLTAAAQNGSFTQINLSWSNNGDGTEIKVERGTAAAGPFAEIATGQSGTTYQDLGLAPNTEYFYRIRSARNGVNSAYSNVANAITNPIPAPTALSVTEQLDIDFQIARVRLNWTNNTTAATGYSVERATNPTGPFAVVQTLNSSTATNWTDNNVTVGVTYSYRVRAFVGTAFSAYTNVATLSRPLSVEDDLFGRSVSLFPNPAATSLQIGIEHELQGKVRVELTDMLGKVVASYEWTKDQQAFAQTIDISRLGAGIYAVEIATDKVRTVRRLVKE